MQNIVFQVAMTTETP